MSFDYLKYLYERWIDADDLENKFDVFMRLISHDDTGRFEEAFDVVGIEEESQYWDVYDICDFMQERAEEVDEIFESLIRNYSFDIEDELELEDEDDD
jgi:hypothetical protein